MKTFLHATFCTLLLAFSSTATASIIPAHAHVPTYALAPGPAIVTAQSNQVVARHYNRLYLGPGYVPALTTTQHTHALPAAIPATIPTILPAHPSYSYATTAASYPGYGYSYGAYPYGYYPAPPTYGYGYGGTYW